MLQFYIYTNNLLRINLRHFLFSYVGFALRNMLKFRENYFCSNYLKVSNYKLEFFKTIKHLNLYLNYIKT